MTPSTIFIIKIFIPFLELKWNMGDKLKLIQIELKKTGSLFAMNGGVTKSLSLSLYFSFFFYNVFSIMGKP